MKNLYLTFIFVISATILNSCLQNTISGNGDIKTQTRDVKAFKSISISGGYEVYLQKGNKEALTVEADENLLPIIISEVKDSVLNVYNQNTILRSKKQKLIITCPNLSSIDLSGATDLKGDSCFVLNNLKIDVSGAAKIDLNVMVNELTTEVSGSAELIFSGKAKDFTTSLSGAGKIRGEKLEAKNCSIEISGMGEAKVNVSDKLDVTISGMGEVEYIGNPEINQSISGAGKVKKMEN